MSGCAHYGVVEITGERVVIRDLGPWDKYLTVTNDAANIVEDLIRAGELRTGMRLFYYDSEGELGEILVRGGYVAGFAPAHRLPVEQIEHPEAALYESEAARRARER
jgi:hypothetical protein